MKTAQLYYWAIVLAFCFGIYTYKYHLQRTPAAKEKQMFFKTPRIGQNFLGEPLRLYDQNHLSYGTNYVMGKFPFTDYIFIDHKNIELSGDDFFTPSTSWWDTMGDTYPADGLQLKPGKPRTFLLFTIGSLTIIRFL